MRQVQSELIDRVSAHLPQAGGAGEPEATTSSGRKARDPFKVKAVTEQEELRPDVEERRWEGRSLAKDILQQAGFKLRGVTSEEYEEWAHPNGSVATVERSGRWGLTPSVGMRVCGYDPALLRSCLFSGKK
jgi:hypothetical protein